MQLANTPPLQSTAPGLHPVSIHQTAPLVRGSKHPITAYYSIYRPRKDERLSRPAWLVTYRNKVPPPGVEPVHVTHPSTNRARHRVTSLIRPTPLPLRHAATWYGIIMHDCKCLAIFYSAHYYSTSLSDNLPLKNGPPSYIWFLQPTPVSIQQPKGHLDQFSRFCTAHERYKQILWDRQTYRPHYSTCSNRPLSLAETQPN